MAAPGGEKRGEHHGDALFSSFPWLDDNDQLDLRLTLHDYPPPPHTAKPLPEPPPPPPGFRRRLSLTKLSFARSSVSSSRPATKDSSPPLDLGPQPPPQPHARRKSRTLSILTPALLTPALLTPSLLTPAHAPPASRVSIDPTAAHYQDPEARSKLRAYLASPQKFDEALEFGFASRRRGSPDSDGHGDNDDNDDNDAAAAGSFASAVLGADTLRTFFEDDASSLCTSEQMSVSDSESPRTPHTPDKAAHAIRPLHLSGNVATLPSKLSDGQALEPTASREMTLRMTLTRPDLRDQRTAWRHASYQHAPHSRTATPDPPLAPHGARDDATRESMAQFFADIDRELHRASSAGRVKRFWSRVRRA